MDVLKGDCPRGTTSLLSCMFVCVSLPDSTKHPMSGLRTQLRIDYLISCPVLYDFTDTYLYLLPGQLIWQEEQDGKVVASAYFQLIIRLDFRHGVNSRTVP